MRHDHIYYNMYWISEYDNITQTRTQGGGGCRGCRSTPPVTAGIDFYSGFGKNDQGGVQIEILKKIQV